jgi:hypothetical protein
MKSTKNKQKKLPLSPASNHNMDLYTLCRWASLKEAIDIVGDKCEERNIDFNTFELKPLDLLKYVDSMTDEIYNKALQNKY